MTDSTPPEDSGNPSDSADPQHPHGAHWSPDQPEPWSGGYAGTGTPGAGSRPSPGGGGGTGASSGGAGGGGTGGAASGAASGMSSARPLGQPSLGVSAALRATADLVRRAPRTVLAMAAVLSAIAAVVQGVLITLAPPAPLVLPDPQTDPATALRDLLLGTSPAQMAATIGVLVISLIVQAVATGLYAVLLASAEPMTGRQAWRRVRPRLGALIAVSIGATVAAIGILAGGAILASALGASPLAAFLGLVILLGATAAGVWVSVSLVLAPAAVAVEWLGPVAAWRRSLTLIRGTWWRTLLVWVVAQIVGALGGLVLTIPASIITLAFGTSAIGIGAATAVQQFAAGLFLIPLVSIVVAVLHADRLARSMSDPGATLGP